MASGHFPPHSWLGHCINMTAVTPSDITSVTKSVMSAVRIIDLASTTSIRGGQGFTYDVPLNCTIAAVNVPSGTSSYRTYERGSTVAHDVETNSDVSANYMAVSGSVDASYSISKTFQEKYQYAIFAHNSTLFTVSFDNYISSISPLKLRALTAGLVPFDPTNPTVVSAYRRFFQNVGTHVIISCNYGARFQLTVWASNENSAVNSSWGVDVAAAFNGLVTDGKFDASVKSTDQYKTFLGLMQKTVSCSGGDPAIAEKILALPQDDNVYQWFSDWSKTARNTPDVVSLSLTEIWTVMAQVLDSEVNALADDVQNAFKWIVANPRKHRTKCRLSISSDWGQIGLLTPSAFIRPDPEGVALPAGMKEFNETKILWGQWYSYGYKIDVTIDFIIENDGSPVDIQFYHGSRGVGNTNTGRISVVIYRTTLVNDKVTDNVLNASFEHAIEVDPNASD
ncbi:hypothetical protein BV25DRAFT_1723621 [Artomyces pyxidatus]|uniref:Uncharacterized protein n=1 Tax=Artomyces pyxidatus TaxID=48021 RepID=A0ACB8SGT8_9AGAM|nr:hypothetical protein BV25DRAFT_1723621 [Artomyces pyxidatus]